MRLQREMAGVKKTNARAGNVAPEGLGAGRQKERIVLAPHRQQWRLVGAEVVLESRIECNVAVVVAEQIQLDLIGAGARQIEVVQRQAVRRDRRLVGYAVGILPARRFRREE